MSLFSTRFKTTQDSFNSLLNWYFEEEEEEEDEKHVHACVFFNHYKCIFSNLKTIDKKHSVYSYKQRTIVYTP